MLIKACLNGSRAAGMHPRLPLSPEELAREARGAVDAGAGALHVHPRDAQGRQTLAAPECGAAIAALRASCPGIPVGLTTAAWIVEDEQERLTCIREWHILPDFVSA